MFKLLTLSCLLAVSVQCKSVQNPAVPYSPQPYPSPYPQVYAAQPKYNVHPAYVAAAPYSSPSYRQYLVPANPAYNPYYYGYAQYPAYPQPYPSYTYAPRDENEAPPPAAAQPGWGEYLSSNFWNYVPNFPTFGSESQQPAEAESGSSSSGAEQPSSPAEASPGKGDKPAEAPKKEQKPAGNEQPAQAPTKQFGPSPFVYFGQPQFYGQLPYQQAIYDPSKLNAANNGAVSSFLFYRNQPQPAVFQQPQPFANEKYYQAPVPQYNQDTAAVAYQRYLQYQKQQQEQQGQFLQQDQPFQQPQQSFQQQQQSFEQQQQQQQQESFQQKPQQDESSVVVDSNASGVQSDTEGKQQQAQSKLATGSN